MKSLSLIFGLFALFPGWSHAEEPERTVKKVEEYKVQVEKQRTVTEITKKERAVLVVFDFSGSMASRMESDKLTVRQLLDNNRNDPNFLVGAVPFSGCYQRESELDALVVPIAKNNSERVWSRIRGLQASGGTDLVNALKRARSLLAANQYADVLLITDNMDTCHGDWQGLLTSLQNMEKEWVSTRQENYTVEEKRFRVHIITENARRSSAKIRALSQLAEQTGGQLATEEEDIEALVETLSNKQDTVTTNVVTPGSSESEATAARAKQVEEESGTGKKATQPEKAVQKNQAGKSKTEGK